jgi:hypothetical protein
VAPLARAAARAVAVGEAERELSKRERNQGTDANGSTIFLRVGSGLSREKPSF